MSIYEIAAFNLAILGACLSPGPAWLAVMRSALASGRQNAIRCGLGLACGALVWSMLAVLGLSALFAIAPWAFVAFKLIGAAYLLWFAYHLWQHASEPVADSAPIQRLNGFRLGFLVNIANPKAVLFISAIFTTVFDAMPSGLWAATILFNHLVLETVFYSILALVFASPPLRALYGRLKAWCDRVAAGVLGVLAVRIVT